MSVLKQYAAAISINLISMSYGIGYGWASPNAILLQSDESPMKTGKITLDELSWITSLMGIGGAIGTVFFGWTADKIGRKRSALLCAPCMLICHSFLIYGLNSVYFIYIARFLVGFGGAGACVIVPMYITEIAQDNIRGTLGSTLILVINGGIVCAFVFGTYFDYLVTPIFGLIITALFVATFSFFPESPLHLENTGRDNDALLARKFFHGTKTNVELLSKDGKDLSMDSRSDIPNKKLSWKDFQSKTAKRGMFVSGVAMTLTQFCGTFAITNYAAKIFEDAGSTLDPNLASIFIAILQFLGAWSCGFMADRLGRRPLYFISTLGTALCLTVMGIYCYFSSMDIDMSAFSLVPIVALSGGLFIANFAIITLPFSLMTELLPIKIQSLMITIYLVIGWSLGFLSLKIFPLLADMFGLYTWMWFYASCCIMGFIVLYLYLPETKGKSIDEISAMLGGNRKH